MAVQIERTAHMASTATTAERAEKAPAELRKPYPPRPGWELVCGRTAGWYYRRVR